MAAWGCTPSPSWAVVVLLSMLSVVSVCHGRKQTDITFSDMQKGKRLLNTTYLTVPGRGVIWCARQCNNRGRCQSFHYDLANLTCHLNEGAASQGVALGDDADFMYGEDDLEGLDDVVGGCAGINCSSDEKCATDFSNVPRCDFTRCPSELPEVNRSQLVEVDTEEVTGVAFFDCEPGFKVLTDDVSLTCLTSGLWMEPRFLAPCKGVCNRPPGVPGAPTGHYGFPVGHVHRYNCYSGYNKGGSDPTATCQRNLTWTQPDVTCTVPNSHLTSAVNRLGYNAVYECNLGYRMNGTGLLLCQTDAEWAPVDFFCDKVNFTESVFGSQGELISKNYPDPYPLNETVEYNITLPSPGHNVAVWLWYEIQGTVNCTSDYLFIDNTDEKFCGRGFAYRVVEVVNSSSISVTFVSDCCYAYKGFFLKYQVQ